MTLFASLEPTVTLAKHDKQPLSALVYDAETRCCTPGSGDDARGLKHCRGWDDYVGMGVSVVCAYDFWTGRSHVFMKDNLRNFETLANNRRHLVGFNSLAFDDKLLAAHGVNVTTTYDLLGHVRAAARKLPKRPGAGRPSYKLGAIAEATLGTGKDGDGALAPVLWQTRRLGELITYCLNDVMLTRRLFERRAALVDPNSGRALCLEEPG